MASDPFYEQILAGLNGTLNPQDFEDCVADVLREMFPTLVPVRGGKDSGMDGAIADGEGEPFPLVVTTGEDVERNLRESLQSFVDRNQPARKVVLATSRPLTPQRRLKLMDLAREQGFTLVQLIDQRGVANLLYKCPRWYKKLLGLAGQPSALSVVPSSRRPLLDLEPIGRAGDLDWLQKTTGDRVLSGEPGSGKTFLLYYLARQGWGLFLVDPDGDVAGALREQGPRIVIVDDAHAHPGVLEKLRHLRQQTGMEFSIVATTWEGARNEVLEAMGGLPEGKTRKLELLTRAEILEVFRNAGVAVDAGTMRYLIDQAANKPGLAVTIATLWLSGSWQEVLEGQALSRALLSFFNKFVGPEATDVLAAFSLGGDRGMAVETVREFLDLSRLELRQIAAGLAAGGVLSEIDEDTWAVWPRPLRYSLIRTVFFPPSGQPRYPYLVLVNQAPKFDTTISTIIAARALNANVPERDLRDLVARSSSPEVWRRFADLSSESAKWVLDNYSGNLLGIAEALLHQIPQLVVSRLLSLAESFSKSKEFRSETAMSMLSSWVEDITAGPREWIRRRELVGAAAREYLREGGDPGLGVYGISIALSPARRGSHLDPGMGSTVTMQSDLLPVQTLQPISQIWDKIKDAIPELDAASWQQVSRLLWDWLHPEYVAKRLEIPEASRQITRSFVERVLKDLVPLSKGSPGLQAGLSRIAAKAGVDLGLARDEVFELLYPPEGANPEGRPEGRASLAEAVGRLAQEWVSRSPQEIASRIAFYEREAQRIGYNWSPNVLHLFRALAESVVNPGEWLDEGLRNNQRNYLLSPFLERLVQLRVPGWEHRLKNYLESDLLGRASISAILMLSDPPESLLSRALERSVNDPGLVEDMCVRTEIPIKPLRAILLHSSWEVSLAAAVGEWCADPQGDVREDVRPQWRSAILNARTDEYHDSDRVVGLQYWFRGILANDPSLALEWLLRRIRDPDVPESFLGDSPFAAAIRVLGSDRRGALLQVLQPAPILGSLLPVLIGSDIEMYRRLLERRDLKKYHLVPLRGIPGPVWESFAIAALDAGSEPENIAHATLSVPHSWTGSGVEHWEQWDQAFAAFEEHLREDLREVARRGRELVQAELQGAQRRQRRFELYGLGRSE